jgi:predicted house-cleaning noncanonical NTP pyrophosphatase (MazG superfamily)
MTKVWNALVRDRIPEIIEADGFKAVTRTLTAAEFFDALHDKLVGEAAELKEAADREDVIAEAADVLEVLTAVCDMHGVTMAEVSRRQTLKRGELGAFRDRVFLIETR